MTAVTVAQLQSQLSAVQTAIDAVLSGGQSYEIDGFIYRRADLGKLEAREKRLVRQINAASSTNRMNRTAATF